MSRANPCKRLVRITVEWVVGCKEDLVGGASKIGLRQKMSRANPCKRLVMNTVELVVGCKEERSSKFGRRQKEARGKKVLKK